MKHVSQSITLIVQNMARGNDYVDFLIQTLKPFIDENYRTLAGTQHTIIAGSSMGGLIAMFAALKYPKYLDKPGYSLLPFGLHRIFTNSQKPAK